jgi:hypothetical protein
VHIAGATMATSLLTTHKGGASLSGSNVSFFLGVTLE